MVVTGVAVMPICLKEIQGGGPVMDLGTAAEPAQAGPLPLCEALE